MAITVRLVNKSQVTRPEASLGSDDDLLFSRGIYQILGSLTRNRDMATVETDGSITIHWELLPPEYEVFVVEMDRLWQHTFYPELAVSQNIPLPTPATIKANEYLGNLGVTQEYFYSKDVVDIPAWVDTDGQTEYRILADFDDNTYLVDESDNTFLVKYT